MFISQAKDGVRHVEKLEYWGFKTRERPNPDRPRTTDLSMKKKLARLEAQNLFLQAENELLKKIDMAERRLSKKKYPYPHKTDSYS